MLAPRLIVIVTGLLATISFSTPVSAWTPPIGIPDPGWGITTPVTPAIPNVWTAAVPPFYYIDFSNPAATDTPNGTEPIDANGNRYGSPASPRQTIPAQNWSSGAVVHLLAGSVIYLAPGKNYNQGHAFPLPLIADGTVAAPVFVTSSPTNRAIVTCRWEIAGTYLIGEHIHFTAPGCPGGAQGGQFAIFDKGSLGSVGNSDHIAMRHIEEDSNIGFGSGPINGVSGNTLTAARASNVIIYDFVCHNNGDWSITTPGDDDNGCFAVGDYSDHVWIVDSQAYTNSDNGFGWIACSGAIGCPYWNQTHHLYFGRNVMHNIRESCIAGKEGRDIIISQNTCFNVHLSPSGNGAALTSQYAPENVWFIFNHIYNSDGGIFTASDSGGPGTHVYIVGNLIHNLNPGPITPTFDPTNVFDGNACVELWGGLNVRVVNNTMYGCANGITGPSGVNVYTAVNNIISNLSCAPATCPGGSDVFFNPVAPASDVVYNLFDPAARIKWNDYLAVYTPLSVFRAAFPGKGLNNVEGSPQFVDPRAGDFHLKADSPARGRGIVDDVYSIFEALYGLSIRFDFDGRSRAGGTWDIGAYGYRQQPSVPTNLRVTP